MYNCIICRRGYGNLSTLAYHIKSSHAKEAKEAYRRGYWLIKMSDSPVITGSMFDEVDKIPSQEAVGKDTQGKDAAPIQEAAPLIKEGEDHVAQAARATPSPSVVKVEGPLEQAFFIEPNADLIVGATGSGKTVNIGRVADYVLAKYGKLSRAAGMNDNYGPIKGKVDAKQIDYWPMSIWKNHIDIIRKACQGWWPLRPMDPDSPIVPPDSGTYVAYGFMAYEGLTTFGDAILTSLGDDQAKLSQSPSYVWQQGDSTFSGGNESYYGFMQKELNRFVMYTNMLKFEKVLWTALEAKGDDQGSKVYGPMIGGKKAIGKAGAWFCNFFHMDILAGEQVKDKDGNIVVKAKHVLFLKTHMDAQTMIPFPCKVRPPVEYANEIPAFMESGDVTEAYTLLDKLYERQMTSATEKMNSIAGLRERLLEQADKARKLESEAAEKRAKAAKLLKPMVSVPAVSGAGPTGGSVVGTGQPSTPPSTPPKMPAKPVGAVTIQPAGKK